MEHIALHRSSWEVPAQVVPQLEQQVLLRLQHSQLLQHLRPPPHQRLLQPKQVHSCCNSCWDSL